jgi:ribosomal protein S6--L-glutamate ligase
MRLIAFDALRCLDIPGTRYIKPELMFRHKDEIKQADRVLFPEYWQVNSLAYSLQKRIFPSLGSYHLGHDKIEMTRAFWALCPEHVPHTAILPATPASSRRCWTALPIPLSPRRSAIPWGAASI